MFWVFVNSGLELIEYICEDPSNIPLFPTGGDEDQHSI